MLERYSYIRISAKQAAIASLDQAVSAVGAEEHQTSGAQNWAQSAAVGKRDLPN
jgi:hypothetical protein